MDIRLNDKPVGFAAIREVPREKAMDEFDKVKQDGKDDLLVIMPDKAFIASGNKRLGLTVQEVRFGTMTVDGEFPDLKALNDEGRPGPSQPPAPPTEPKKSLGDKVRDFFRRIRSRSAE